jgi:hypothetical protein
MLPRGAHATLFGLFFSIFTLFLFLLMTPRNSQAQASDSPENPPAADQAATEIDLQLGQPTAEEPTGDPHAWRWKYRPLILFADTIPDNAEQPTQAQEQARRVAEVREGFVERDMILVVIRAGKDRSTLRGQTISRESAEEIRRRFFADSQPFEVVLVGKDGSVKLRQDRPVEMAEVFRLIDSMPMRRREMRE